jgi:UDPglucose 6-dehydrogenase
MKIAIVGVGYVGLVTGTCFSEVGFTVTCVDNNPDKVASLKRGENPIFEPGLDEMIHRNIEAKRLHFTGSLSDAIEDAKFVFIAVGTPEDEDGSADLSYVVAVAESIGRTMNKDIIVVVKSTVPVGTNDLVEETIQKQLASRGVTCKATVVSNPEFLKEGSAIKDFMQPDRIIIGLNEVWVTDSFRFLYKPFVTNNDGKVMFMDRRSAEVTKYAANAMLALRISFMNEMARFCETVGANIDQIRLGIGADDRIGNKYLLAGPGYGGSCFPKDVTALIAMGQKYDVKFGILEGVEYANKTQASFILNKIKRTFSDLSSRKIAIWGLAFKPGTDDVRRTPSLNLIEGLLKAGASVVAHDPEAATNFARDIGEHPKLTYVETRQEALEAADALVLMTEWNEYRTLDWAAAKQMMKSHHIFDYRNQYDGADAKKNGFSYEGIGRPSYRA